MREKVTIFKHGMLNVKTTRSKNLPTLRDPEMAFYSAPLVKQDILRKDQTDGKLTLQNVSLPPIYIPFFPKTEVRAHSPDEVVKTTQENTQTHNTQCFLQINFDDYFGFRVT